MLPQEDLPAQFRGDDVRYSETAVRAFVEEYTRPGDLVLDPFAGYGTTLAVAESMGRRSVGIEILPERAAFVRARAGAGPLVVVGDARRLAEFELGPVDLVMTSPPYMTRGDHPQDPLTGYTALNANYTRYLHELREVFGQVGELLAPAGRVIINVANLRYEGVTTPLAWDVAQAVSEVLSFEREIVLLSDGLPPEVLQDYCLVFGGRISD